MHIDRRFDAAPGGCTIGFVVLLLGVVCLGACGRREASSDASRPLRIAFGIGPSARASGVDVLTNLLYTEPLISHDASGRPEPALAADWTWADGGRLLTLRLKPGVIFHDGTPLTSDLVVALLRQLIAEAPPLGLQRVTDISAPDPSSVTIRLSKPDFFLLTELNELRIVHPEQRDIGTGPFRLVRRQPLVEAQRFDAYHGGKPASPAIQILTYETHRAAWAALMRGDVDAVQELGRESVEFVERSSHVETFASMQPYYIPLVFNQRHATLGQVSVRRALSLALDRAAIVERAMRGLGVVADSPIWPSHWAYEAPPPGVTHDPRRAAALLDDAGFEMRRTAGGPSARFAFRCLFWSEDPQYERIALMVQKQLFDIGVQVDLEPVTLRTLAARAADGNFDAFLARANAGRSQMFTYMFWRSPRPGEPVLWQTGYTGADAALDRLRESVSESEARESLRALGRQFSLDAPAAFIAWTEVTRAVGARIGVGDPKPRDPFTSIWRWHRLEPEAAGQ